MFGRYKYVVQFEIGVQASPQCPRYPQKWTLYKRYRFTDVPSELMDIQLPDFGWRSESVASIAFHVQKNGSAIRKILLKRTLTPHESDTLMRRFGWKIL